MTPADLSRCLVSAVRRAVEDGELGGVVPARVVVERTRPGGVGEYATPVAFQIAKGAGRRPAEVAEVLARRLGGVAGIERVEVTGAGFLNFSLSSVSAAQLVRDARRAVAIEVPDVRPSREPRERLVRAAVARIEAAQEVGPGPEFVVAPVARRDGDVLARYGADAVAWAVLTTPARETPEFSDALLVQGEGNELFRVRYAHARAHALVRNAEQLGFRPEPGDVDAPRLLRALADHPLVLEAAAHHRAPERLARHLVELADALLDFQYRVLPQGDEKPSAAHRARLALAEAAGTVLAGGLALLGIDAPTRL
ncbi:ArgS-related anticodon-binding protein NrtL [Streptomyces virginiae]|uniref:ArgS-related anticodon-binding protein NrtL n=1 Tax=Streptomyces virginiae TaxID=1961 RepID=UPI00225601AF|nr:DALR anticodon-binding domain-containing protein [Streptomyces virginiae]MCX4958094.1 DALR anticodon-binding domain-containing protein [Streptomyces virginiae]MCX5176923.1 DALR anticodon-binding domain-containing protein [Streptomyces virginiae]